MNRNITLPLLIAFVAILFPASLSPNLFVFRNFGPAEITQLLTFLVLISLFLERALEVFITTWRRPGEEVFDNKIHYCERQITELKEEIGRKGKQLETVATKTTREDLSKSEERTAFVQGPGDTTGLLNELEKQITLMSDVTVERGRYKSRTRKIALWSALFVGILVSGVGIRALETLVQFKELASKPLFYQGQLFIFRSLDTLLTGGLIAGGSEGIHKVVQVFTTFLEETQSRMKG